MKTHHHPFRQEQKYSASLQIYTTFEPISFAKRVIIRAGTLSVL
jgi:hypothetical protein